MRKVITEPSFPGSTDIGAIELDAKSRNDIPVLLIGLQVVYLDELLDLNGLPKKGKLSAAERERESEPAFAAAWHKHSGVESAINSLVLLPG